ncbi:hypothetical protein TNCV_3547281 [Trichonephila clavipes]|nr:hypothetical protein TNCV_3547281 [Trichonephila clavipes]
MHKGHQDAKNKTDAQSEGEQQVDHVSIEQGPRHRITRHSRDTEQPHITDQVPKLNKPGQKGDAVPQPKKTTTKK